MHESCARHGVRVSRWHLASPQQSTHPLARRPGMPPYTTHHTLASRTARHTSRTRATRHYSAETGLRRFKTGTRVLWRMALRRWHLLNGRGGLLRGRPVQRPLRRAPRPPLHARRVGKAGHRQSLRRRRRGARRRWFIPQKCLGTHLIAAMPTEAIAHSHARTIRPTLYVR